MCGRGSLCTGTFIGRNIIATAAHCLNSAIMVSACDGFDVETGVEYQVAQWYLPQTAQWSYWPGVPLPDFALLVTSTLFAGTPIPVASMLPDPTNIAGFNGDLVAVSGFAPNTEDGDWNTHRLTGTMVVAGTGTVSITGRSVYTLVSGDGSLMRKGDSGGPVVKDGALVGVLSAWHNNEDQAGYVMPQMLPAIDADGDGVADSIDNCPTTPNADQADCDYVLNPGGDACDPNPCVYYKGVGRIDGDRMVWVDHGAALGNMYSQGNSDIYLHDLGSGKTTPVVTNPARQDFPDVDGDWVVWKDWRNNPNPTPKYSSEFKESDIYAYNLKTGKEVQVTSLPGLELRPKVDGGRVFYVKGAHIFMVQLH